VAWSHVLARQEVSVCC